MEGINGLKEALTQGAFSATRELGRPDGFLSSLRVKIPVPEKLKPVDSALRKLKQSRIADQFAESLNRAAERAAPAALAILGDAVKAISISDGKGILTDEEKRIREDPKARVSDILRKVFGR